MNVVVQGCVTHITYKFDWKLQCWHRLMDSRLEPWLTMWFTGWEYIVLRKIHQMQSEFQVVRWNSNVLCAFSAPPLPAFPPPPLHPPPCTFLLRSPSVIYLFIYLIFRAEKYFFDESVPHPKAVCLLFIRKQVTVQWAEEKILIEAVPRAVMHHFKALITLQWQISMVTTAITYIL